MTPRAGRRRALVTGGAGFIGGHLVERLLEEDWDVRVLDDFSSGREENLANARDGVDLVRGDIRDEDTVARAVDGVEVVFHHAAVPSVPRSVAEPLRTNAVNIEGTLRVLESARRHGVRRVVYAASSSAYGDTDVLPKEEGLPARPLSPYALQKYCGEVYCRQYTALHGLETVSLRYFNVFGPRQDPKSEYAAVVPRFACAALDGTPATLYGDGGQTRDFTFVGDAVRANLLAADGERASGAVINIAGGKRTSVGELWGCVCEIVGADPGVRHETARAGDVRDSVADLSRARDLLDYEPAVSLREGLRLTIESFAKTRGPRR